MHKHLHRLSRVLVNRPHYCITAGTHQRKPVLANRAVHEVLRDEWLAARERHGWAVGRYVIMPDHVHFFCAEAVEKSTLSMFVGAWKEWTAKQLAKWAGMSMPLWQPKFFDHVLRADESFAEKWEYVRLNPVRQKLVETPGQWPFQGFIHYDGLWV